MTLSIEAMLPDIEQSTLFGAMNLALGRLG
jgi:hypothetical protein